MNYTLMRIKKGYWKYLKEETEGKMCPINSLKKAQNEYFTRNFHRMNLLDLAHLIIHAINPFSCCFCFYSEKIKLLK